MFGPEEVCVNGRAGSRHSGLLWIRSCWFVFNGHGLVVVFLVWSHLELGSKDNRE